MENTEKFILEKLEKHYSEDLVNSFKLFFENSKEHDLVFKANKVKHSYLPLSFQFLNFEKGIPPLELDNSDTKINTDIEETQNILINCHSLRV